MHTVRQKSTPQCFLPTVLCVITILFLIIRNALLNVPNIPVDEYAYLAAILESIDHGERYIKDPMLQQVYTPMFVLFGKLAGSFGASVEGIVNLYELLNVLFALSGAGCFFWITNRYAKKSVRQYSAMFFVFPFWTYSAYLMPDTLYFLYYSILCVFAISIVPKNFMLGIVGMAAITAAMFLTKPNAVSILLATSVSILFYRCFVDGIRNGIIRGLASILIYLVCFWVSLIVINNLLSGKFVVNIFDMIGKLYQNNVNYSFDSELVFKLIGNISYIGFGHLVSIAIFLLLPGYSVVKSYYRLKQDKYKEIIFFATFVILSLIFAMQMAIIFTAQLIDVANGQLFRLHGRYYTFMLPSLFVLLFLFDDFLCVEVKRLKRLILLATIGSIFLYLRNFYTIYPIDYPELLVGGGWDPPLSNIIIFMLVLGLCVLAPLKMTLGKFQTITVVVVFSFSLFLTTLWQFRHTEMKNAPFYDAGRAASMLTGNDCRTGKVAVVGKQRHFGEMASFLFGLSGNPWVSQIDELTLEDINYFREKNVSWIFNVNKDVGGQGPTGIKYGEIRGVRYYKLF